MSLRKIREKMSSLLPKTQINNNKIVLLEGKINISKFIFNTITTAITYLQAILNSMKKVALRAQINRKNCNFNLWTQITSSSKNANMILPARLFRGPLIAGKNLSSPH
jgi:hypothetical protein